MGEWKGYLEDHPRTCKWLGLPLFTSDLGYFEGEQPYLADLLTIVINHLLTGMILQVPIKHTLPSSMLSGIRKCRRSTVSECEKMENTGSVSSQGFQVSRPAIG